MLKSLSLQEQTSVVHARRCISWAAPYRQPIFRRLSLLAILALLLLDASAATPSGFTELAGLKQDQEIGSFRVANLYSDPSGSIVGAKFLHVRTNAPVFLLQMQTVPKAYIWVDTPDESDRGIPHALEHLLAGKGTKGRYVTLLTDMQLSQSAAATYQDFNFYGFSSGTGMEGFFAQLHAWLDALFRADFSAAEAERELYHFGVSTGADKRLNLAEEGSVYDEEQADQSTESYYFELNKRILGPDNPFSSDIRGNPGSMRQVSPEDIRGFYKEHYKLGPSAGFIFVIDPKENVTAFLNKASREFDEFSFAGAANASKRSKAEPKYPIHSSQDTGVGVWPFPAGSDSDAAAIRVGWKPAKATSLAQLELLELFFHALAGDQNSVLYKAAVNTQTREIDTGARKVDYDVFLQNSPFFPFEQVEISGIPGDRLSAGVVERIRDFVLSKIKEVSEYPDGSPQLQSFNAAVAAYAKASRKSQSVWIKMPPLFGIDLSSEWKKHLGILEMDDHFVRSLSEEQAWQAVERQLQSGKNVWRDVIRDFHLLDMPYAMASKPSTELLKRLETAKQERIRKKIEALREKYQVGDDQEALRRFAQDESNKSKEIQGIEARIRRPRFTAHPPLTPDDEIRYQQFRLGSVPVIASIFDRPPSIDIGLAFDLRGIPRKYYKYLPILPRCFDSIGLKSGDQMVSYGDLLTQIQDKTLKFSVGYEENAASKRADLVFRTSVTNDQEFKTALDLVSRVLRFSRPDLSSLDRLRDITDQRLAVDDAFKGNEFLWMQNAAYSFLTQGDQLFQGVYSAFTRTHWDERMKWRLHKPVTLDEIDTLGTFASEVIAQPGDPGANISRLSQKPGLSDLQRELLQYWARCLPLLPATSLPDTLNRLTSEVQEDLRIGPAQTISEIRDLQQFVLNRQALHIDLVSDEATLATVKPEIADLARSLPALAMNRDEGSNSAHPVMAKVEERYHLSHLSFPWRVGLVNSSGIAGDIVSYADLPGYSQLDRSSLLEVLSANLLAGDGPQSLFIKTREAGLAYAINLQTEPAAKLLWDYADRSPDLPSLIHLFNATAESMSEWKDPLIVDYALRQTFSIPRSIYSPSIRGIAIAQDLRDGNGPATVQHFSRAILNLRHDPQLLSELTHAGVSSICGILLERQCEQQQRLGHSIFIFVGSEKTLADTEKQLPSPLLRVWPSDFWLQ